MWHGCQWNNATWAKKTILNTPIPNSSFHLNQTTPSFITMNQPLLHRNPNAMLVQSTKRQRMVKAFALVRLCRRPFNLKLLLRVLNWFLDCIEWRPQWVGAGLNRRRILRVYRHILDLLTLVGILVQEFEILQHSKK